MNYEKIYKNLIYRAKNRIIDGYVEKHHIIPKCMGGSDSIENLVILTPEEHFLAHVLLVKIYPTQHNLIFAVQKMTRASRGRKKRRLYGWLKRLHSKRMSESQSGNGNTQYGTMWINNGTTDAKILKSDSVPEGWIKGRKKKNKNCSVCGIVVFGNRKYCSKHRPTTKGKILKSRFASEDKIKSTLIECNLNIDHAMKKLGYKTAGGNARYRFIKIAAEIV